MANYIVFAILAVVILGSAVMCVTTKRIMRAATFLLFVLFGIAGIYFLLDYTFLGAAIQLVNKRTLQGMVERMKGSRVLFGAFMALLGLAVTVVVFMKNMFIDMSANLADAEVPMKEIGTALVGSEKYQYVLPFEFISVFLLACIIGGIVISRKE